jgi:ABC-type multidrug transport system fused ATPase/permease subunit
MSTASQGALRARLEHLMSGRTTFIIAHRLNTLAGCDVRLEVAGGRIAAATPRKASPAPSVFAGAAEDL